MRGGIRLNGCKQLRGVGCVEAAAPQPELCGLRSSCGRRACARKAGPGLCTRQEPCPPAQDLARSAGVATAGTRTCGDPSARDDAGPRA